MSELEPGRCTCTAPATNRPTQQIERLAPRARPPTLRQRMCSHLHPQERRVRVADELKSLLQLAIGGERDEIAIRVRVAQRACGCLRQLEALRYQIPPDIAGHMI
eukprot:3039204-Rhodomonas_salina.1